MSTSHPQTHTAAVVRKQLVSLLFSPPGGRSKQFWTELGESGLHEPALRLAAAWHVLPRLSQRVSGSPALRKLTAAAYAQSAHILKRGVDGLAALGNAGIRAAAFKGAAAIAGLYGSPRNRTLGDVDILVSPHDWKRSVSCLSQAGFRANLDGALEDYVRFVERSPAFAGNLGIELSSPDRGKLDLHWQLGIEQRELSVVRLLERAQLANLYGRHVLTVNPVDSLLLTAHHAFRENMAPDTVLRDFLDIETWCQALDKDGELEAALSHASRCGLRVPLLAVLSAAVLNCDDSPAGTSLGVLKRMSTTGECAEADRLAELFQVQVDSGALNKDLLHLMDRRSIQVIAGSLLSGWRQHREAMRAMERKIDGRTRPLLERATSFIGSLAMSARHLALLRSLVRAKRSFRA